MSDTHDHAYKLLFSEPEIVADLLRGFVREPWVEDLDFSTLEKVSGSYISEDLRSRENDVVWRVRSRHDWVYIYLLIEFQSTVDRYMAVRLMTYIGLLYQDLVKSKQTLPDRLLPPVFPVVLYNGEARWQAPVEIKDLIVEMPGGLARYLPSLRYLILDEGAYDLEDLAPLRNLVAAIFRLEQHTEPKAILEVIENLLEWLSVPEQARIRRSFSVWIHRVLRPAALRAEPASENLMEVKTMLANRMQEWMREWELRGEARGEARGKAIGEIETLLKLLELKFGPLPGEARKKIRSADSEQVHLWIEHVLTVDRLNDLFD